MFLRVRFTLTDKAELALRQVRLRFEGVMFDLLHSKKHVLYSKKAKTYQKHMGF